VSVDPRGPGVGQGGPRGVARPQDAAGAGAAAPRRARHAGRPAAPAHGGRLLLEAPSEQHEVPGDHRIHHDDEHNWDDER